uniref:hypothetical protein n=1 Tax=Akkermansia sp. TaxID=1872421 RepID=UPI003AB64AC0
MLKNENFFSIRKCINRKSPNPNSGDGKCTVCGAADPNANSGGNTGNNGTDSPTTADGAAKGPEKGNMEAHLVAEGLRN